MLIFFFLGGKVGRLIGVMVLSTFIGCLTKNSFVYRIFLLLGFLLSLSFPFKQKNKTKILKHKSRERRENKGFSPIFTPSPIIDSHPQKIF